MITRCSLCGLNDFSKNLTNHINSEGKNLVVCKQCLENLSSNKQISLGTVSDEMVSGWGIKPKDLQSEVKEVLDEIYKLFVGKNGQYRTDGDDFANFTTGALLRYGKRDYPAKFEALKDMVEKHIAKVYNGKLHDDKMDESIKDIAVYFILATVMHKRMLEEQVSE